MSDTSVRGAGTRSRPRPAPTVSNDRWPRTRKLGDVGILHLILLVYAGPRGFDHRDHPLRNTFPIALVAPFQIFRLIAGRSNGIIFH